MVLLFLGLLLVFAYVVMVLVGLGGVDSRLTQRPVSFFRAFVSDTGSTGLIRPRDAVWPVQANGPGGSEDVACEVYSRAEAFFLFFFLFADSTRDCRLYIELRPYFESLSLIIADLVVLSTAAVCVDYDPQNPQGTEVSPPTTLYIFFYFVCLIAVGSFYGERQLSMEK